MLRSAQHGRPAAAAAVALALFVSVAGCSAEPEATPQESVVLEGSSSPGGDPLPEGAPVPAFEGPFAGMFTAAYRQSTSDLQRSVLDDGQITELEMSALRDEVVSCLADGGVAEAGYQSDGTLAARTPGGWDDQALHDLTSSCQESGLGQVDLIFNAMRRDPDNLGESARMVPCLQEAGLVDSSFTAEDYAREMASGAPSFDTDDTRFTACLSGGAPTP